MLRATKADRRFGVARRGDPDKRRERDSRCRRSRSSSRADVLPAGVPPSWTIEPAARCVGTSERAEKYRRLFRGFDSPRSPISGRRHRARRFAPRRSTIAIPRGSALWGRHGRRRRRIFLVRAFVGNPTSCRPETSRKCRICLMTLPSNTKIGWHVVCCQSRAGRRHRARRRRGSANSRRPRADVSNLGV